MCASVCLATQLVQHTEFVATASPADFQHVGKSGKDKGVNVREHAKNLVGLIQNEAQLQQEREIGVRNHQRFTQLMGDRALAKAPKKAGKGTPSTLPEQSSPQQGHPNARPSQPNTPQTPGAAREYAHPHPVQQGQQGQPMMPTVAATPQEAQAHTEEQMLAMALRMSSLEANGQERLLVEEQEQQELAIALSLSMAEADGIRALRDPMDSSDDDSEPTPPSTPYGGKYVHRLATICEGASARAVMKLHLVCFRRHMPAACTDNQCSIILCHGLHAVFLFYGCCRRIFRR